MYEYKRIGELLLSKGLISEDQLHQALAHSHDTRRRVGEVIVQMGFVEELGVTKCLAEQYHYEIVDPNTINIDKNALAALDGEYALAHLILPIKDSEQSLECIIADPIDIEATDFLSVLTQRNLIVYLAPPSLLEAVIRNAYSIATLEQVKKTRTKSTKRASSYYEDRDAIITAIRTMTDSPRKGFFARLTNSSDTNKKAA